MEISGKIWFITPMPGTDIYKRKIVFFFLFLILLLTAPYGFAEPVTQVVSTSPSWNKFTNIDGTGLYHEILARIFNPHGIQVTHRYTNAKRGIYLVKNDIADIYTCRTDVYDLPDLVLAQYPMYEGEIHAFFKKDRVKNWQGVSSLTNQRVVWRWNYYNRSEFPTEIFVLETDTGEDALGQVVLGRGDFYIDDLNLIKESISKAGLSIDMDEYRIEPVGKRSYYPVFKKSPRGKFLMDLYETGMKNLHWSGELKKIFMKWQFSYPAYEMP
ncbi:substrate-binding periplasmic protein [Desulfospira joergensenii]|uniref:substrate-binding periplasmic protein n=1 Tax=Desulfospira joergensenii TaxID=53329 RepID=UPI0004072F99|nr:transporter substrate-binding domain-containing protein [Desulfospira joergensenii]